MSRPSTLCTAKNGRGNPCKAHAITGGKVCRSHGGSAPQVIAAAVRRILMAADPAAARLVSIALGKGKDKRVEVQHSLVAIRELLNRAGVVAVRKIEDPAADNGQVLWEEFIQIHRRRVPEA